MAATYTAGKAKRKDLAFFYKVSGEGSDTYELIGKGIEDASISQSADVETVTDITGNSETTLSSYEKTTDLDPVYMEGGNKFSEFLDTLEETQAVLDDCRATFLVVKMYKKGTTEGSYVAWEQDAIVELTEFGGDVKGVNLPCTLHWTGERTLGNFTASTKTFSANA